MLEREGSQLMVRILLSPFTTSVTNFIFLVILPSYFYVAESEALVYSLLRNSFFYNTNCIYTQLPVVQMESEIDLFRFLHYLISILN